MSKSRTLSDLLDEWIISQKSKGVAKTTIDNRSHQLRAFIAHVGNVQVRSVEPRHVDGYFAAKQAKGLQPSSLNAHRDTLKAFFVWCELNRYVYRDSDPMRGRSRFKVMPKSRLRVPADQFPRLLDCAPHPRDRIVVALGLYLFLRQSEVAALRVQDVNLAGGSIHVKVEKSKLIDDMPISVELDRELRRWMTFYSARVDLQAGHYLCPAKGTTAAGNDPHTGQFVANSEGLLNAALRPTEAYGNVHASAQRTLELAGYPIRDENDRSLYEGIHTLRRSGARALYDYRIQEGKHDGVIREVQSMLHHASVTMTERYLGLEQDRATRDARLRGQWMFGQPAENVIKLVKEGQ